MSTLVRPVAAILALTLILGAAYLLWSGRNGKSDVPAPAPDDDPRSTFSTPYRNVRPDVNYVDDKVCARCHVDIAKSYGKHPMGRSLAPVSSVAASQRYDATSHNPFSFDGVEFLAERRGDEVFHKETRRDRDGSVFATAREQVQFAIGSGIHNYSYLIDHDGCIVQSPITWYEQKAIWDLSPGFAARRDFFERPIFPECLFCHSNRVEPVPDTLNTYRQPVFRGYAIGCQRCHGPGELHVQQRERGDLATGLDDTIVNPRRLQPELREAVCQQCHLEGVVRILAPGRNFFDYRPGMPWQPFWSVLVKSRESPDRKFVSAVEQMYASTCFRGSNGKLGCISCHDPHYLPSTEEKAGYYRARCMKCHETQPCSLPLKERLANNRDNCILCHMPAFDTTDIQHTAASDHQIPRKPQEHPASGATAKAESGALPLAHFGGTAAAGNKLQAERALAMGVVTMQKQEADALHFQKESVSMALSTIEAALRTWPDDVPTLEARWNALAIMDRKAEQLAMCEAILHKAPAREENLVAAAALARYLGKSEMAIAYWQRAIKVNPWPIQYHAQLANLYADRKEWPKMLDECREIMRRYPASLEARILLVSYYLEIGETDRARRDFELVLALKPPNEHVLRDWFQKRSR